jgi:hypothetical protein
MMGNFDYVMHVFSNGVPGVVLSGIAIILVVIALVIQEPWVMVLSALLTFPFTYSMGGPKGMFLAIRFLPLLQLGSAFAISKKEMLIAIVAPVLPSLVLASYLLKVILAQF